MSSIMMKTIKSEIVELERECILLEEVLQDSRATEEKKSEVVGQHAALRSRILLLAQEYEECQKGIARTLPSRELP